MSFYNKLKWILGILMIFVLIVTTNLIDKNNFVRVRDSVVTIYEDRLVAKNLIFEMSKIIQEKELAIALSDSSFFKNKNTKCNGDLQLLVAKFEETKLTTEESRIFSNFKAGLQSLLVSETEFLKSDYTDKKVLNDEIANVKDYLNDLAQIQLSEGGRQLAISKRAVESIELFTQIEIYILVFLAIVIQIIVMYKPKEDY
jgi:hypothetical protein